MFYVLCIFFFIRGHFRFQLSKKIFLPPSLNSKARNDSRRLNTLNPSVINSEIPLTHFQQNTLEVVRRISTVQRSVRC